MLFRNQKIQKSRYAATTCTPSKRSVNSSISNDQVSSTAMTSFITVFIKTEWIIKPYTSSGSPFAQGSWPPENKIERIMSEKDASALEATKEVAEEFGMRLEIRDLAAPRGWFSTIINRVKVTPTIIIDDLRVEGTARKDALLSVIKKTPTSDNKDIVC